MRRLPDIVGKKFGRLTVMNYYGQDRSRCYLFSCLCECGQLVIKRANHLIRGEIKSCGCFRSDFSKSKIGIPVTHGATTNNRRTGAYRSWCSMKARCTDPKHPAYESYHGNGINICQRWLKSFENFFEDMGDRPDGLTLERKDNSKGYSKDNCVWASLKQQGRNKRTCRMITHNGKTQCISAWAEETGIWKTTIKERLNRGWSPERALTR